VIIHYRTGYGDLPIDQRLLWTEELGQLRTKQRKEREEGRLLFWLQQDRWDTAEARRIMPPAHATKGKQRAKATKAGGTPQLNKEELDMATYLDAMSRNSNPLQ